MSNDCLHCVLPIYFERWHVTGLYYWFCMSEEAMRDSASILIQHEGTVDEDGLGGTASVDMYDHDHFVGANR